MPGGVINTGSHPKLLWPGIFTIWGQTYDEHAEEYRDLYDVRSSDKAYEQGVQVTPFNNAVVKGQGAPVTYDGETQGVVTTYTHVAYALGYMDDLRDPIRFLRDDGDEGAPTFSTDR